MDKLQEQERMILESNNIIQTNYDQSCKRIQQVDKKLQKTVTILD